jgi:hypothetical protein
MDDRPGDERLLLAVAAFTLDEPASMVVDVTPTGPIRRTRIRAVALLAPLAAGALVMLALPPAERCAQARPCGTGPCQLADGRYRCHLAMFCGGIAGRHMTSHHLAAAETPPGVLSETSWQAGVLVLGHTHR